MAIPQKPRTLRWRPWLGGGGLFVLFSLGLHWAVLQIPIADQASPQVALDGSSSDEPTETIDVVRLSPPTPDPPPGPVPAPTPAPVIQPSPAPQSLQTPLLSAAPVIPTQQPQPTTSSPPTPEIAPAPEPMPEPMATSPPEPTPEPSPEPTAMTLDERLQTLAEYRYNDQAKSVEAAAEGFSEWHTQQDWFETYPFPGKALTPPLQVTYPLTTCLPTPPAIGMLAVILGPDGSLLEEPILASSTGYDLLDEKALEAAKAYDFPAEDNAALPEPKVRPLQVDVVYDAEHCTN